MNRVCNELTDPSGGVKRGNALKKMALRPTSSSDSDAPRKAADIPAAERAHPCHIAVRDDSATVRKIIEVCLRREGSAVRGFGDGVEALHAYVEGETPPALIFLDIHLPKMDGYEVARSLSTKPAFAQTILVMLSRSRSVVDRLKARICGVRLSLTKPYSTQTIIATAHRYARSSHHPPCDRPYGSLR
jgi:twitching motility two-component system response regulator PilG